LPGQPRNDWFALIELSNGYIIHENRMAPNGTGAANLFMYDQQQFTEKKNSENYNLIDLTTTILIT
jgi:hypothetical protein